MSPFPAEDRETYPEMFALPKGVREVSLPKPLGIAFEERCNYIISQGRSLPRHPPPASLAAAGSRAAAWWSIISSTAATRTGQIQPGDWLILVTALYLRPSELCSKEFYQGEVERNRAN